MDSLRSSRDLEAWLMIASLSSHARIGSFLALFASLATACGSGGASSPDTGQDAASSGGGSSGSGSSGGDDASSGGSGSGSSGGSSGADSGASSSSGGSSSGGSSSGASGGDAGANSCSAAQVGVDGDFKGYRMFPADHPINTAIDKLLVSAHSADWLANCSQAHPYLQIDLSMPYNIVPANTPTVTAIRLDYNSKPYPNPWPFPATASIESGDGHCLAFDVGTCKLYEVYNFAWGAGMTMFTGGSGTVWDTTKDDPGNGSGSDAAGLPITPLLIRYDELIGAGAINHALRFTCASTEAGHIAPARASASSSAGTGVPATPNDPKFPPMGMRVRLKASYDPTAHSAPPPIVALLKALQKYGLLLADNGSKSSPMYITGASDSALSSALSSGASIVKMITTADLEVVDTGEPTQD
jgi:hypothetical protein